MSWKPKGPSASLAVSFMVCSNPPVIHRFWQANASTEEITLIIRIFETRINETELATRQYDQNNEMGASEVIILVVGIGILMVGIVVLVVGKVIILTCSLSMLSGFGISWACNN
jgi:hypothetical protein